MKIYNMLGLIFNVSCAISVFAQGTTWSNMQGSSEYFCLMPAGTSHLLMVGAGTTSSGSTVGVSAIYDGIGFSGTPCQFPCNALYTMAGTAPTDIYAGGYGGSVQHWNGSAWSSFSTPMTTDISSLCTPAPGQVWVCNTTTALHFNYGQIKYRTFPTGVTCNCSWATANTVVVGGADAFGHFNAYGNNWTIRSKTAGSHTIRSIWGSSENDIYAVGDQGTMLHFDGIIWSPLSNITTNNLRCVWGTGPYDIYVVGDNGTALYYNGVSWNVDSLPPTINLTSVTGTNGNIYACGPGTLVKKRDINPFAVEICDITLDGWVGPSLPPVKVSVDGGPAQTITLTRLGIKSGRAFVTVSVNSNHTINISAPGFKHQMNTVTVGTTTGTSEFSGPMGTGLIPGDINNDGVIDDTDLLDVINHFLSTTYRPADVNGDGIVDDTDLLSVINHFLQ